MSKETGSTQEIINIDRIENNAVVLKSGGLRKILLVSGVSFDLKSEEEKNLILFGYQDFLNSLDFSIQQVVHSRKLNIEGYLTKISQAQEREDNQLLRGIMDDYRGFIDEFVSKNPIMAKTFFIIVPYDPVIIPPAGRTALRKIFGVFRKNLPIAETSLAESSRQLDLRMDQVVDGLNRLGIRAVPLAEAELIEMFYNFYNPGVIKDKHGQADKSGN